MADIKLLLVEDDKTSPIWRKAASKISSKDMR